MNEELINKIQKSFEIQAENFENKNMSFSKQEFLDYTVKNIGLNPLDKVIEVASGTCAVARSIAPHVESVVCLDATPAMLEIGKKECERAGILNVKFKTGVVEKIPYPNACFDVAITRLSFHHFNEMEQPFFEMDRILKSNGKLVIIDMEATQEDLREIEDKIESLRDFSHVKNRSKLEFEQLYAKFGYQIEKCTLTPIPVKLDAWLNLTNTSETIRKQIISLMLNDINNGIKTGVDPYLINNEIWFNQRWLSFVGTKKSN